MVKNAQEIRELKQGVLDADLSLTNPGIVRIIENELTHWVEGYEAKKEGRLGGDCYGSLKDFPKSVKIDGVKYTSHQILEEVKGKTSIGLSILEKLMAFREEDEFLWGENGNALKRGMIAPIKDNANPDEVFINCACGRHNLSYRQFLLSIINAEEDSTPLTVGWPDAIKKLYGAPTLMDRIKQAS